MAAWAMFVSVFVWLLYRMSVQVLGWLASLSRDEDVKTAELLVLRHQVWRPCAPDHGHARSHA
jgi:hypothetical protein